LNALKNFKEAYVLAVREKSNTDILESLQLLSVNDKENHILYNSVYRKVP